MSNVFWNQTLINLYNSHGLLTFTALSSPAVSKNRPSAEKFTLSTPAAWALTDVDVPPLQQ